MALSDVEDAIKLRSPLIERGQGDELPGLIARGNYRLCSNATVTARSPLTVAFPKQQWAFGLVLPLARARPSRESIVVQLKVRVRRGKIGIAGVDSTFNTLTTIEKVLAPGISTVALPITQPCETAAVFLRTVSEDEEAPEIELLAVNAYRSADFRLAPRRHDLGYDLFVILSRPKTATQTIEQTLLSLGEGVQVRRSHFISPEAIQELLATVHEFPELAQSPNYQANYSGRLRHEIEAVRTLGGRIAFISGKREPIDQIVSAVFQQIPTLVPGFARFRAAGIGLLSVLKEYVNFQIRKELAFLGDPDGGLPATWEFFKDELVPIAQINALRHPIDQEKGFSLMTDGAATVLLYKYERIGPSLASALSLLTGRTELAVVAANLSAEKKYADLYNEFLQTFRVPADLCSAIYDRDPSMRLFYSDAEIAKFKARWSE